jgi:hypothetical protein
MTSSIPQNLTSLEAIVADFVEIYGRLVDAQVGFLRLTDLQADEEYTAALPVGEVVRIADHGGFDMVKVNSGVINFTSASGSGFRVRMDRSSPLYFDAVGDGEVDDTAALDALNQSEASQFDLMGKDYRYVGSYVPSQPIFNGRIIDDDGTQDYRPFTEDRIATVAEAAAGHPPNKVPTIEGIAAIVASLVADVPLRNVVQTLYTSTALYSAQTVTELDVLTTSITTTADNSRVEIKFSASIETNREKVFRITRNGVPIADNTTLSPGNRRVGAFPMPYDDNTQSTMALVSFSLIDTVGAAGDYQYRFIVEGTNGEVAVNRTISDSNSADRERTSSAVILEEILT